MLGYLLVRSISAWFVVAVALRPPCDVRLSARVANMSHSACPFVLLLESVSLSLTLTFPPYLCSARLLDSEPTEELLSCIASLPPSLPPSLAHSPQMFELADMWCPTIEANDYAKLLRTVRFKLTRVVVSSSSSKGGKGSKRGKNKRRLRAVVRRVTPEEAERLKRERASQLRGRPGDLLRYLGKPADGSAKLRGAGKGVRQTRGRSAEGRTSGGSASGGGAAHVQARQARSSSGTRTTSGHAGHIARPVVRHGEVVPHKQGGDWDRPWRSGGSPPGNRRGKKVRSSSGSQGMPAGKGRLGSGGSLSARGVGGVHSSHSRTSRDGSSPGAGARSL